ncbi:MAG: sigma 54-interacting transcriptional regulator, partial [Nitrospirota bacterium]|nr:sigma 54-interacting transcriptional regulator [Nitrospirota bacterium]
MKSVSLKKLFARQRLAPLLQSLISSTGDPLTLEDADGTIILEGIAKKKSKKYPVEVSGEIIGWASGGPSAEAVASLVSYLAGCEVEKKSLGQETLSRYKEITLLYAISEKMAGCLDPAQMARLVIEEAQKAIPLTGASVMLLDEETGKLEVIAAHGKKCSPLAAVGPDKGIAGSVLSSGMAEIVNDTATDARYVPGKNRCKSMICAPLKVKDRVIGVINISNENPTEYTAADLKLAVTLAIQAASAIENARLYATLKELTDAALEENRELKDYMNKRYSFQNIITISPKMQEILRMAEKVAKKPQATVAIFGENGTGKEVLARAIHVASGLMENRFVAVNCAAIPQNLLESELFGHVKGAFTGADRERDGKFDAAQKGTLLLDEIGDMALDLQAKLLRVLQERCYQKVGSNQVIKTDFRVIATTHRDLKAMVREGKFREDLYHRLTMFPITIPSLRDRREDIPLLVHHFLDQFQKELGKPLPGVSKAAMNALTAYSWPGNVRELRNCLERATIMSDDELINPRDLGISIHGDDTVPVVGEVRFDVRLDANELSLESAVNQI